MFSDNAIETAAQTLASWLKTYEIANIEFSLARDIVDVVVKALEFAEQMESSKK